MKNLFKNLFAEFEKSKVRREESKVRRLEDLKVRRLFDENIPLIKELFLLVGSDGGFGNQTRIREIGEELNRKGGFKLMQAAGYAVKNNGRYFSQDIWHGIGRWQQ